MSILSGFKTFERYLKTPTGYQLYSERQLAKDVLMGNGDDESNNVQNVLLQKNSVVNNLTTTEEGYVLDARQGKVLEDRVTELNGNFTWKECVIVPGNKISLYGNNKAYYRYDDKFIEIIVATTLYSSSNIDKGDVLFTLSGIDVFPQQSKGTILWNDSNDSFLVVDFNENHTVTLGCGNFGANHWVGTSMCELKLLR